MARAAVVAIYALRMGLLRSSFNVAIPAQPETDADQDQNDGDCERVVSGVHTTQTSIAYTGASPCRRSLKDGRGGKRQARNVSITLRSSWAMRARSCTAEED